MTITLNGTTGIVGPNGTASAPAMTGSDTDTGIVYGTNTVSLATSGTTAVTVDSSQNVGIATSSPSYRLDTRASAGVGIQFLETSSGSTNRIQLGAGSGLGYINADAGSGSIALAMQVAGTERMRIDSSGNLLFNSGYGSVATAYGCRAWVNFNGTGTVAIRSSGNVSSITDNGTGNFTLNFTNALPDTNYAFTGMASREISGFANMGLNNSLGDIMTTTQLQVRTCFGNTAYDTWLSCVAVFR